MAFRNIKFVVPRETRCAHLVELVGKEFKHVDYHVDVPTSCNYSLKDLLAAGVNVQVINPTVIHDSAAASVVAESVISNSVDTDSVEPSNND